MSNENSNPRAFPSAAIDPAFGGMTLRDWFAGQALAGMMADTELMTTENFADFAREAYEAADAMLAESIKP